MGTTYWRGALAVMLLAAAAAWSTGGSIVASFESPHASGTPRGLAYATPHSRIYHVSDTTNMIYGTDAAGAVLVSIPCPADTWGVEGAYHYYWTCTRSATGLIYRINTTGSVETSFPAPANATGITRDDTHLWVSSDATDYVYRVTTSGSLAASFAAPGDNSAGLDWDGDYLWLADSSGDSKIYQLTTSGSVMRMLDVPVGRAAGVAFDGTYVWYANYVGAKYVYRITIGDVGVEPASFGRLKALFR
ncbi:MAG: DUF5050 domain-containing protein [Candidatus Zixiibacteriota bacterium]|jgi:hypothetical protein